MYECMRSAKLERRFKSYLLEVWWRAYSDKYKGDWDQSLDVLEAFARGGTHMGSDMRHAEGVAAALSGIDFLIQVSSAADALRKRFEIAN